MWDALKFCTRFDDNTSQPLAIDDIKKFFYGTKLMCKRLGGNRDYDHVDKRFIKTVIVDNQIDILFFLQSTCQLSYGQLSNFRHLIMSTDNFGL